MNTTSQGSRPLNFLFNAAQAVLGRGGQIDWSRVSSFFTKGKFTVKLNGAVLKAAVSITVDALLYALKSGTILDFGAEATVVVTLSGNEAIGQTAIGVNALSGPIPAGSVLTSGVGEYMTTTADAAAGATSLAVEALEVAWESGDTATYQGGRKLVKITEDGDVGETALTCEPVQFAIADNAEAIADYTGTNDGRFIPAGTVMARTSSDMLIPRYDAASETASEILQSDARENSQVAAKSGYGTLIEAMVYEELMPDAVADVVPAGYKTEMATNGARINFIPWNDDRTS